MTTPDIYTEEAARLLPCHERCSAWREGQDIPHWIDCAGTHIPAVAAALRASGERIKVLEAALGLVMTFDRARTEQRRAHGADDPVRLNKAGTSYEIAAIRMIKSARTAIKPEGKSE